MPVVHDVVRHPKSGQYAAGKAEFRAVTLRDDDGETLVPAGTSVAPFTADGEGFSIDLAEGLYDSRLRINNATVEPGWVQIVVPPGGGRYLTLVQAFTGVPEDPSALEALVDMLKADAAATYALKGSPFFARRDESVPELFSYFGDDENAYSVVPKFDSGQDATAVGAPWSIAGGTLVPLGSGVRAAYYRSPDMGAVVSRVGGRFRLLPGSGTRTGGGTACIAILNGLINPASITVDMAAHFWTTSTAWAYTVWQAGVGQSVLASGFYSTPLLTDWSTEYELQVWLNGTTATFDLPDGSRHTVMDSRIGSYAGNFAFWESFLPGGDTDDMAAFTHVWCGTGVQRIPDLLLDRAQADTIYAPREAYVIFRDQDGNPLPPGSVTTIVINTTTGEIDDITFEEA